MAPIIAAQHFFTSVPADQSPSKRRGYQTLFRTRGLSDDVVRAIEDRAQYNTAPSDPVKRQFYGLPGNLLAISQSVALAELDEFGRKGRYLTHTLVIDDGHFQQLGHSPIDVLTQFKFAATLAEVFAQGQAASAEVPSVRLTVTPAWQARATQLARQWPPENLAQLGRLAWQAKNLIEQRDSIALIGAAENQLDVLACLFLLTAPNERHLLSFDTRAAGCDWRPGVAFWAQGYLDHADARSSHVIDAAKRVVTSTLTPAADRPYAVWLVRDVLASRANLDAIEPAQNWANQLETVLAGAGSAHSIDRNFIERFGQLNREAVAARWLSLLPAGLSDDIIQPLRRDVLAEPGAYLAVLADGTAPEQMREVVFGILLDLKTVPAKSDRQALEKWIKARGHAGLLALIPFWAKDGKAWVNQLKVAPPDIYEQMMRQLAQWPQPPIALWEALAGPHASTWLRVVAPAIPPSDWKKVLHIFEQSGEALLGWLAQIVPQLSVPARNEITKWLKNYKGDAMALRTILGIPRDEKKGLLRR